MFNINHFVLMTSAVLTVMAATPVMSSVSPEEAAKLKTTLTPLGAEREGNADGSIPGWNGGFTTVPSGYKSGDPRPDFFSGEKPVAQIIKANMAKYADKLADAQQAKNLPGGILVVFSGTVGPASHPFVGVIKAEKQSGFRERGTALHGTRTTNPGGTDVRSKRRALTPCT